MATKAKLTPAERRLIVEVGSQWIRKSDAEVLGEAAVLFRLAVAIVGVKGREAWRKRRRLWARPAIIHAAN